MNDILRNCANCGGRIEQSPDGRVVGCVYCGSAKSVAIDPRALAAGIAADAKSLHAGFDRLVEIFRETLPAHTTVHEAGLLFKRPVAFEIALDELTFRLRRNEHKVEAHRVTTVRGITLSTETMSFEAWIAALAEKLSEMSMASESARNAFTRIAG